MSEVDVEVEKIRDILITTYVPEASYLTREEALKLALERNKEAAEEMIAEIS